MEHVILWLLVSAIRVMPRPAGLVALFGRSMFVPYKNLYNSVMTLKRKLYITSIVFFSYSYRKSSFRRITTF